MLSYESPVIINAPIFGRDYGPSDHIEQGSRLESVLDRITVGSGCSVVQARNGAEFLPLVHNLEYIKMIREACFAVEQGRFEHVDESIFSRDIFNMACYAAGAAVEGANLAKQGKKSFSIIRPPGHHAYPQQDGGFCLFNNVAIGAEYLRQIGERVLIVDIDLHLGDGTIACIEDKPDVFYFSIGHDSVFPHLRPEAGNVESVYLPEGTTDEEYCQVLDDRLIPLIANWKPDIMAISAGFDTSVMDKVEFGKTLGGGFSLTQKTYTHFWQLLDETLIPYFAVLEGGYHPDSVAAGVESFLNRQKH